MIYQNFYIKAPVAMLGIPLPLVAFAKPEDNEDEERYYTIPEYLATLGHTVSRYNNDKTMFVKGFGFSIKGLDEMRSKLGDYGLTEDESFFILSQPEVVEELNAPEWNAQDDSELTE